MCTCDRCCFFLSSCFSCSFFVSLSSFRFRYSCIALLWLYGSDGFGGESLRFPHNQNHIIFISLRLVLLFSLARAFVLDLPLASVTSILQ